MEQGPRKVRQCLMGTSDWIAILQRSFASTTKYTACRKNLLSKEDHKVRVSQIERNLHGDEQSGNWLRYFEERLSTFRNTYVRRLRRP